MKRSVLKSGLAAAIATVMMSCTTAAHAQTTGNTKYIYCQDDTVTPGISETKLSYTEWNAKKSAFNDNKQETIYREDCNTNLLADTQNKK